MSQDTRLYPDAGRRQELFPLRPGDPARLGGFRCLHRLKPGAEQVGADKPTPILAVQAGPVADQPGDLVVVKVLSSPPTADGRTRLDEERAWSRQQGAYRGDGAENGYAWVARDFVQGVSLDQLRQPGEWTDDRRASLARVILSEIERVHRRGEIHCDIKPANVIVHDRSATLIDFESSRDHGERSGRVIEATKPFASPEQLHPAPDRPITAHTDLFSWGLTVCDLYRPGHHPLCGGPFDETAVARLDGEFRQGRRWFEPDLSFVTDPGLRAAVARSLAWQPADRTSAVALLQLMGAAGRNTEVLLGFTQVLQPSTAVLSAADPVSGWRSWLGPGGPLGAERVPPLRLAAYAGAGILLGFVLALLLSVLVGVVLS